MTFYFLSELYFRITIVKMKEVKGLMVILLLVGLLTIGTDGLSCQYGRQACVASLYGAKLCLRILH